jgi:hypothetical protein
MAQFQPGVQPMTLELGSVRVHFTAGKNEQD